MKCTHPVAREMKNKQLKKFEINDILRENSTLNMFLPKQANDMLIFLAK